MKNHRVLRTRSVLMPIAALAWALSTNAVGALPTYRVEHLSPSLTGIAPLDVNNAGDFVAGFRDSRDDLGLMLVQGGVGTVVPRSVGSNYTSYGQINDRGQVYGVDSQLVFIPESPGSTRGYYDSVNYKPFLYSQGVTSYLPTSIDGRSAAYSSLNNQGDLLGTLSSANSPERQAFIYHSSDGAVDKLDTQQIPIAANSSAASLVLNNKGEIYGVQASLDGRTHNGFVYANGQLNTLPGITSGDELNLISVNDADQILFSTQAGLARSLFLYDKGQVITLGHAEFVVDTSSTEYSGTVVGEGVVDGLLLTGDGTVIGLDKDRQRVVYKDGEMQPLSALLDPVSGKGVDVYEFAGADGQGRLLARSGLGEPFWLVPTSAVPEPAAASLTVLGLLALAALLRAKKKHPKVL